MILEDPGHPQTTRLKVFDPIRCTALSHLGERSIFLPKVSVGRMSKKFLRIWLGIIEFGLDLMGKVFLVEKLFYPNTKG